LIGVVADVVNMQQLTTVHNINIRESATMQCCQRLQNKLNTMTWKVTCDRKQHQVQVMMTLHSTQLQVCCLWVQMLCNAQRGNTVTMRLIKYTG